MLALVFLLIRLLESSFKDWFSQAYFWPKLAVHLVVFTAVASFFIPFVNPPDLDISLLARITLTLLVLFLQVTIYVAALHIMDKQEQVFALALNLKQTELNNQRIELNAIRAQNNPHFLFNTLNLIAAEISQRPANAQDIVYDLGDLLRLTLKMTKNKWSTVEEELKMADLYLSLQKKRFPDRLSYRIESSPACNKIEVPSLLLLPAIENAIKYAVAPYAVKAQVSVILILQEEHLIIHVKDSGPAFDSQTIQWGNGLSIMHQTLQIHYPNRHEISLDSTATGGCLTLKLPFDRDQHSHVD